jgi:uncharacterized protein (TIGR00251 family)
LSAGPVRAHPDGAVVAVRAVPGASRSAIVGLHGEELKVRVCSPPVDGRANDEVCSVLAEALGLRNREVQLVQGHSARSKVLLVALGAEEAERRLQGWIGRSEAPER